MERVKYSVYINDADRTSFFAPAGMSVEYEPVTGPNAGVMMDGSYTPDEIATRAVVTLRCRPLKEAPLRTLLYQHFKAATVKCKYWDPRKMDYRESLFTRSISGPEYKGTGSDGAAYWTEAVITLRDTRPFS